MRRHLPSHSLLHVFERAKKMRPHPEERAPEHLSKDARVSFETPCCARLRRMRFGTFHKLLHGYAKPIIRADGLRKSSAHPTIYGSCGCLKYRKSGGSW